MRQNLPVILEACKELGGNGCCCYNAAGLGLHPVSQPANNVGVSYTDSEHQFWLKPFGHDDFYLIPNLYNIVSTVNISGDERPGEGKFFAMRGSGNTGLSHVIYVPLNDGVFDFANYVYIGGFSNSLAECICPHISIGDYMSVYGFSQINFASVGGSGLYYKQNKVGNILTVFLGIPKACSIPITPDMMRYAVSILVGYPAAIIDTTLTPDDDNFAVPLIPDNYPDIINNTTGNLYSVLNDGAKMIIRYADREHIGDNGIMIPVYDRKLPGNPNSLWEPLNGGINKYYVVRLGLNPGTGVSPYLSPRKYYLFFGGQLKDNNFADYRAVSATTVKNDWYLGNTFAYYKGTKINGYVTPTGATPSFGNGLGSIGRAANELPEVQIINFTGGNNRAVFYAKPGVDSPSLIAQFVQPSTTAIQILPLFDWLNAGGTNESAATGGYLITGTQDVWHYDETGIYYVMQKTTYNNECWHWYDKKYFWRINAEASVTDTNGVTHTSPSLLRYNPADHTWQDYIFTSDPGYTGTIPGLNCPFIFADESTVYLNDRHSYSITNNTSGVYEIVLDHVNFTATITQKIVNTVTWTTQSGIILNNRLLTYDSTGTTIVTDTYKSYLFCTAFSGNYTTGILRENGGLFITPDGSKRLLFGRETCTQTNTDGDEFSNSTGTYYQSPYTITVSSGTYDYNGNKLSTDAWVKAGAYPTYNYSWSQGTVAHYEDDSVTWTATLNSPSLTASVSPTVFLNGFSATNAGKQDFFVGGNYVDTAAFTRGSDLLITQSDTATINKNAYYQNGVLVAHATQSSFSWIDTLVFLSTTSGQQYIFDKRTMELKYYFEATGTLSYVNGCAVIAGRHFTPDGVMYDSEASLPIWHRNINSGNDAIRYKYFITRDHKEIYYNNDYYYNSDGANRLAFEIIPPSDGSATGTLNVGCHTWHVAGLGNNGLLSFPLYWDTSGTLTDTWYINIYRNSIAPIAFNSEGTDWAALFCDHVSITGADKTVNLKIIDSGGNITSMNGVTTPDDGFSHQVLYPNKFVIIDHNSTIIDGVTFPEPLTETKYPDQLITDVFGLSLWDYNGTGYTITDAPVTSASNTNIVQLFRNAAGSIGTLTNTNSGHSDTSGTIYGNSNDTTGADMGTWTQYATEMGIDRKDLTIIGDTIKNSYPNLFLLRQQPIRDENQIQTATKYFMNRRANNTTEVITSPMPQPGGFVQQTMSPEGWFILSQNGGILWYPPTDEMLLYKSFVI